MSISEIPGVNQAYAAYRDLPQVRLAAGKLPQVAPENFNDARQDLIVVCATTADPRFKFFFEKNDVWKQVRLPPTDYQRVVKAWMIGELR